MNESRTRARELARFIEELKDGLLAYIERTGTKHAVLASMLGVDTSSISHAIRPGGSISENFVRKLSITVPEFETAYARYYELKYGAPVPDAAEAIAHARRDEAERIARLRAAEEE